MQPIYSLYTAVADGVQQGGDIYSLYAAYIQPIYSPYKAVADRMQQGGEPLVCVRQSDDVRMR